MLRNPGGFHEVLFSCTISLLCIVYACLCICLNFPSKSYCVFKQIQCSLWIYLWIVLTYFDRYKSQNIRRIPESLSVLISVHALELWFSLGSFFPFFLPRLCTSSFHYLTLWCGTSWLYGVGLSGFMVWEYLVLWCGTIWLYGVGLAGFMVWDIWFYGLGLSDFMMWD